jgi:AcrR family transcriptional regulator
MPAAKLLPQQARSRKSFRRLLDAAEHVLNQHGFQGATLARIAARANLSPANVYRRFYDKEALMRAVFTRASEANVQQLAKKTDSESTRAMGIRKFTRQWIAAMIKGYRARTGLTRATVQYAQQHARTAFVRRQRELEIQGFRKLVDTFLMWRDEIRHPDPEYAVNFGLLMVVFALRELILFDQAPLFSKVAPVSDVHLREELPRMFLRYLGIETK